MLGWYNISMSIDNDEPIEEQSKFFWEALKCFDKALEIDPNYTHAWVSKGLAFFNKKDYDQALMCYDKALEIDPNYTHALNNKGYAWNSKGDLFLR
jgi:tetratricopeptide (TPR) repeat protein